MKLLSVVFVGIMSCVGLSMAAPALTNSVFSQTTISNMFYTNRISMTNFVIGLSNNNYLTLSSNFNYSISNLQWLTFSNNTTFTTNFAVLIPDSTTNWMKFTNGILGEIVDTAP